MIKKSCRTVCCKLYIHRYLQFSYLFLIYSFGKQPFIKKGKFPNIAPNLLPEFDDSHFTSHVPHFQCKSDSETYLILLDFKKKDILKKIAIFSGKFNRFQVNVFFNLATGYLKDSNTYLLKLV